jgi:sulfotransferase family protein
VIIIIGRGHGGTRLASRLLLENGVATGHVNYARDLVPPHDMYRAVDLYSEHVEYKGDCEWDFSRANAQDVPDQFRRLIHSYLSRVLGLPEPRYFKLPEATLCYPWLKQIFPDAVFVHWVRDPRDALLHRSDRIKMWGDWGIEADQLDEQLLSAMSWKYQYDIVESVPRPERFITVRYEDFCLDQEREVARLSEFLGLDLKPLPDARPDAAYRWTREERPKTFAFLEPAIEELGYDELPAGFR